MAIVIAASCTWTLHTNNPCIYTLNLPLNIRVLYISSMGIIFNMIPRSKSCFTRKYRGHKAIKQWTNRVVEPSLIPIQGKIVWDLERDSSWPKLTDNLIIQQLYSNLLEYPYIKLIICWRNQLTWREKGAAFTGTDSLSSCSSWMLVGGRGGKAAAPVAHRNKGDQFQYNPPPFLSKSGKT